MSTSATQPGTTTRAGRSGKGLGIAAAALAIVIAAGFVFAINQGNEATVSDTRTRAAQIADDRYDEMIRMNELAAQAALRPNHHAEIDRLNALATQVQAMNNPGANPELFKLAQPVELGIDPGANPELLKVAQPVQLGSQAAYVPSVVQPVEPESAPLNQPEWDNRMP